MNLVVISTFPMTLRTNLIVSQHFYVHIPTPKHSTTITISLFSTSFGEHSVTTATVAKYVSQP